MQQQQQSEFQHGNKAFLKVLERAWKPLPPWCVAGRRVPDDLNEELSLFHEFMRPSPHEQENIKRVHGAVSDAVVSVLGKNYSVTPAGITATGLSLSEGALFFSVNNASAGEQPAPQGTTAPTAEENEAALDASSKIVKYIVEKQMELTQKAQQLDEAGGAADGDAIVAKKAASPSVEVFDVAEISSGEQQRTRCMFADRRGGFAVRLKEASSAAHIGRSVVVYIGRCARDAKNLADKLSAGFASPNAQASLPAWQVLLSSLKQTRNCDDFEPTALCSDAAAVMMLSVVNSYDAAPSCSQALTDFFLLYGFASSFDISQKSITVQGALVDVAKIHAADAISIVDPSSNANANLTAGMTSASVNRLVNVLAYCYRVIAEYSRGRAEQERGRAESTLSTFLGGGPYWGRVVALGQQGAAGYAEAVQRATDQAATLAQGGAPPGYNPHQHHHQHHHHHQHFNSPNYRGRGRGRGMGNFQRRGGGGNFQHHQQQQHYHQHSQGGGYDQHHQQQFWAQSDASAPPSYAPAAAGPGGARDVNYM